MRSAVIYGGTKTGIDIYLQVKEKYDIRYFVDGNPAKVGGKLFNLDIYKPEHIFKERPEIIIMGILTGYDEAIEWLVEKGFPEEYIICSFVDLQYRARKDYLEKAANIIKNKKIKGAVAELGVYRGAFAKCINGVFPDRTLYLFDTFEGFLEEDLKYEKIQGLLKNEVGKFSNTSEEYVLGRMPYPDKCIIKKGYFPDTAEDLNERFAFVNIDVDLYKPILSGLEYFWPKMSKGGYILVHDFFSLSYAGTRKAIEEFADKHNIGFVPIGDTLSVAFVKDGESV